MQLHSDGYISHTDHAPAAQHECVTAALFLEENETMKRWRYVLLVLCTAVISISGTYLMNYFMKSEENKQKYEDISEIGFPETEADHEEENDQQDVKQSEDDFDYQSLIAMNSDCVGWIQIPGTDINYPVVQAADNEFYLTHNFNRETAACGAIFMDYRNDVDAKAEHLILYGHQMKDNSMFKQLNGYKEEIFYKEHPNIKLYLHEQKYEYEITAVYVTDVANGGGYYNYLHWNTRKEQLNYLQQKMAGYQIYDTGKKVMETDELLSLSTCEYSSDNGRLIVQARRKGEMTDGKQII